MKKISDQEYEIVKKLKDNDLIRELMVDAVAVADDPDAIQKAISLLNGTKLVQNQKT